MSRPLIQPAAQVVALKPPPLRQMPSEGLDLMCSMQ
jgi:hypothetical protein